MYLAHHELETGIIIVTTIVTIIIITIIIISIVIIMWYLFGVECRNQCDSNSLVLLHTTFSCSLNPNYLTSQNWLDTKLSTKKLLSVPSKQYLHNLHT